MSSKSNHTVIQTLSKFLADSYVLLLKTQNYHWNVTGPGFHSLHLLFEGQYNDLFAAVDLIAERIRSLGEPAPGSFAVFGKMSSVKEETGAPDARAMIKNLYADHETLAASAEAVIKAAQEVGDEGSADLAIGRLREHQKAAWMLKAHIE